MSEPDGNRPDPFEAAYGAANALLYREPPQAARAFRYLLARSEAREPQRRARVLDRLCIAHRILGHYDQALREGREALSLFESIGDDRGLSGAFISLGNICWSRGDLPEALSYYESALELRDRHGDRRGMAGALGSVANILSELGELTEAKAHYQRALALSLELGDTRACARTYNNLAECHLLLDDLPAAEKQAKIALRLVRQLDDRADESNVLINLGRIQTRLRDWSAALDTLDEASALATIAGDRRSEAEALMIRAQLTEDRGREDPSRRPQAALYRREALALAEEIGARVLCLELHRDCAVAADRGGDKETAAWHWAAAQKIRDAGPPVSY